MSSSRKVLDEKTIAAVRALAGQIRQLLPGYRGSVEFHMPGDVDRPVTVNMHLCNVTEVKG